MLEEELLGGRNQRPSRGHQEGINATHLLEEEQLGGRNQRQSRGHQEAINATHLLEEELLGGRDGALRLEIAARLMRDQSEAPSEASSEAIGGNLRQSEAIRGVIGVVIGGHPRPTEAI